MEITLTNKKYIHEEFKSRLNYKKILEWGQRLENSSGGVH
jgi:hypothetical protein